MICQMNEPDKTGHVRTMSRLVRRAKVDPDSDMSGHTPLGVSGLSGVSMPQTLEDWESGEASDGDGDGDGDGRANVALIATPHGKPHGNGPFPYGEPFPYGSFPALWVAGDAEPPDLAL
ncbi:hypothetical protein ROA7023_04460 [Roseisalinus antarcticus]|uniref:Uncharacterized protein n=1 Tax=Roseisalinus antarcticus TaxID=254357 RepID=A0A1Y5U096_9RHOB|nr:hypothetical protein ROA7023_04460 [Roseisalinus antarcticus]